MSSIPSITENDVLALVGERSFELGKQYFHANAVSDTQREGSLLKGRCEGSHSTPYRVEIVFDDEAIVDTTCSCPLEGNCKHVAALLLTWLAQPETFVERKNVDIILQQLEKSALIALIKNMLRQEPDLEDMVLALGNQHEPVNPALYRRQVERAFAIAVESDWGAEEEVATELDRLLESADSFAQQANYARTLAIYTAIMHGIMNHYDEYDHEGGGLHDIVDACIEGSKTLLADVQGDAALRTQILQLLFTINRFDIIQGGISFGEEAKEVLLEETTEQERAVIVEWIRKEIEAQRNTMSTIPYSSQRYEDILIEEGEEEELAKSYTLHALGHLLLYLASDTLDDESYLHICRDAGLVHETVERLLAIGRIEEATKEARRANDRYLLNVINPFINANQETLAEQLILERAWKTRDARIQDWVKQHFASHITDHELKAAIVHFKEHPDLQGYREVRTLAVKRGRREQIRAEIFSFLKTLPALATQIALEEDETDDILDVIQATISSVNYQAIDKVVAVIEEAENTQPEAALKFYRRYVTYLINKRSRPAYQQTVHSLYKIRALYQKLGRNESWTHYIAQLRENNKKLKALLDVLKSARL